MTAFDDGLWTRLVEEHGADRINLRRARDSGNKRPLLLGVSGAALVSIAALATVLSLAGGATNAFAGWTPQPAPPTAAQLAAAEAYCVNNMQQPGLPLKLTDARGPFTIQIYSDGSWND